MAREASWSVNYLAGEARRKNRRFLLVLLAVVCLVAAATAVAVTRTGGVRTEFTIVAAGSGDGAPLDAALRPPRLTERPTTSTTEPLLRSGTADEHSAAPQAIQVRHVTPEGYGCAYALAWLASHAAPGFRFVCPGYALGHQAMTCDNVNGVCPGEKIIVIAVPCAAAYMNEAHNSWIIAGLAGGSVDPYGYCH